MRKVMTDTNKNGRAARLKEKRMAALMARAKLLESKLKTLRENRKSLSFLIENEMEKAELVIAAKSILDKLQGMAEDLAKVEADDLMPMMDNMKAAFGPEAAEQFDNVTTAKVRQAMEALKQAKDQISTQVMRLEGDVTGEGQTNDMANMGDMGGDDLGGDLNDMDSKAADDVDADELPDEDLNGKASPKREDEPGISDTEIDDLLGNDNAAHEGRSKKESAHRRGRALRESEDAVDVAIDSMARHSAKMGVLGREIEAEIRHARMSDAEKRVYANVLKHLASYASEPYKEDAEEWIEEAFHNAGVFNVSPEAKRIAALLKKLAHLIVIRFEDNPDHDGMKVLPDSTVYESFRARLKEGHKPVPAARRVAESLSIDFEDVVAIVREAKEKIAEGKTYRGEDEERKKKSYKSRAANRRSKEDDRDEVDEGKTYRGEDEQRKKTSYKSRADKRRSKEQDRDDIEEGKTFRRDDDDERDVRTARKGSKAKRASKRKKSEVDESKFFKGDEESSKEFEDRLKRKPMSIKNHPYLDNKLRSKEEVAKQTGRKFESVKQRKVDEASPQVAAAVGRITAQVVGDVESGKNNPMINPKDLTTLKVAQQQDTARQNASPSTTTAANTSMPAEQTLAATVSKAVQRGNANTSQMGERAEGKMNYPISMPAKRDRDPRHPANRGVSARRGFVGS